MKQVVGGEIGEQASLLERSLLPDMALRRIFESEETGLFHLTLGADRPVLIGHDQLVSLILCLEGRVVLSEDDEEVVLESGAYSVVREAQMCALAARGAGAEVLLFFGFEQLPGAFFNSYGPANV
ncbi:MAG TPA: hypothetical protein VF930_06945 [Stellaceae bacterium]